MSVTNARDQVLPETRWLAWLVIPFLGVAFIILYLFPYATEQLFAWRIQPSMTAMMLGAAYSGGIYYFVSVLRATQWHTIKVGIVPVISFASFLGIATILHWDRFTHNHVSFFAWVGLYFTAPILVIAVWLRNRGQDPQTMHADDIAIPPLVRIAFGIIGAITLAISLLLFLVPALLINVWPWTLTPLTARVVGAMFALPGIVGLGIARDQRWSSARMILQAQSFSILMILGAALRSWADFDQTQPATWLFVGGLVIMLIGIGSLYFTLEKQRSVAHAVRPVILTGKE
jgi:hypothetical protein